MSIIVIYCPTENNYTLVVIKLLQIVNTASLPFYCKILLMRFPWRKLLWQDCDIKVSKNARSYSIINRQKKPTVTDDPALRIVRIDVVLESRWRMVTIQRYFTFKRSALTFGNVPKEEPSHSIVIMYIN